MSSHDSLRKNPTILIIIFGFIIYTPLILGVIEKDKTTSQIEKRNLATLPKHPTNALEAHDFPTAFNAYYADHFGLRELFTKTYFKVINKINGQSSSDHVTFGADDWMFLGSIKPGYTHYGDPMGDVTNINLYTSSELKEFAQAITKKKNWLHARNIAYVYIIAPNKHTIYFDKLPSYILKKNPYSAMDQLINYLTNNTDITIIDVREALSNAKKHQQLYYKTDTHWNYHGANIAQFEILKKIEKMFPERISATKLKPTQFKPFEKNDGDLARFANLSPIVERDPRPIFNSQCTKTLSKTDSHEQHIFSTHCQSQTLNALIFRDSFFTALQPYFSEKFKNATFVAERINLKLLKKYIKIKKPDIVIDEIVERTLPYLPKNSSTNFF